MVDNEADGLRERARECRRLAAEARDNFVGDFLRTIAEQLDAEADTVDVESAATPEGA
jgi:hypothetical protein